MPMVLKYDGEMPVHIVNGRFASGRSGPSAIRYGATTLTKGGSDIDAAASATPGTASSAGTIRRMNDRIASPSPYFVVGSETFIATRPSDRKPTGACTRLTKARSRSPAPTSSISDSATSTTTSSAPRRPGCAADHTFANRHHAEAAFRVRVGVAGVRPRIAARDLVHFRLNLVDAHARRQPRDSPEIAQPAGDLLLREPVRFVDVCRPHIDIS